MSRYRKLEVWKDSCLFAKEVYEAVQSWKDYGLRDQITRSAVSIASNIAEGSDRGSDADFARFLRISKASCEECRTQLHIAHLVGHISFESYESLDNSASSISNRIGSLIKYLKNPRP
jgi:four helix bundle protein